MSEKARIFIVEDDFVTRTEEEDILARLQYKVCGTAAKGEDAIRQVEALQPHAVIMDITLKGEMDGIEAAGIMQESFGIPVVFVTSHSDEETLKKAKLKNPYGYIVKPFDEKELKYTLDMALYRFDLEVKLRKSEEKYRLFIESYQGIAYQVEIENSKPNMFDGAVEQVIGYTAGNFLNGDINWADIIFPGDQDIYHTEIKKLLSEPGYTAMQEYRVIHKDGRIRWIRDIGKTINTGKQEILQGTVVDITERKQAETAFLEAKERTETILQSIQNGVLVIDTETHLITEANPTALAMIGANLEEVVGRVCHQFICPNQQGNCPITDEDGSVDNRETVMLKADGVQMDILKSVVPITLEGRKCLLETFVEITERKRTEEELQRILSETERMNRLMTGREDRLLELKAEVNELLEKQGCAPKYGSVA